MSEKPAAEAIIAKILAREPRYRGEAYAFVSKAVEYTVSKLPQHRHVSAEELLYGARAFSREKFGALAEAVLRSWGLKSGRDFGNVVYLMIDAGLLSASPGDRREDFDIVLKPDPLPPKAKKVPKIDR